MILDNLTGFVNIQGHVDGHLTFELLGHDLDYEWNILGDVMRALKWKLDANSVDLNL